MQGVYSSDMDGSIKPSGKRERTREQLIAAAERVIEAKGLAGASLEAIAREAGMTRGAIYSNFESRADLLLAVVMRRALRIDRTFAPAQSLQALLRQFAHGLIEAMPKAQGVGRWHAEFQLYSVTDPEMRAKVAAIFHAGFEDLTRRFESQPFPLRIPARSLVLAVQAMAMGYLYQAIMTPGEVCDEDVLTAFDVLAEGAAPRG